MWLRIHKEDPCYPYMIAGDIYMVDMVPTKTLRELLTLIRIKFLLTYLRFGNLESIVEISYAIFNVVCYR